MALNKKMHPRNPYRTPPSFKDLALKNEEFRRHAKIEISGKVSIDFKNADALRALTRALLKEDWGLDIHLPTEYLVPTLPLRLNYIFWLEDLISTLKQEESETLVYGIDIGTGASCIYPLLAAKKNGWHMIGTEKNETSYNYAVQNVQRNNLQFLVKVCKVDGEKIIMDTFQRSFFDQHINLFDFCMCNPPFFASEEELEKTSKSRSTANPRSLPHNARTGSPNEVVVEGGEVAFVLKMIDESLQIKDKIRIFSTMLGHKASVSRILQYLKEKCIHEVATTEFCQGHVTRWGLAWSHIVSLTCESLSPEPVTMKQKSKPPLRHVVSVTGNDITRSFDTLVHQIKLLMDKLSMEYKCVIKDTTLVGYQVTVRKNTWSNQRRKRRDELKKTEESCTKDESNFKPNQNSNPEVTEDTSDADNTSGEPPLKKAKISLPAPFVVMGLTIREDKMEETKCNFLLEMNWLSGSGGRDAVHQIMQYMKNNVKC